MKSVFWWNTERENNWQQGWLKNQNLKMELWVFLYLIESLHGQH